jgi:hypothetical protein
VPISSSSVYRYNDSFRSNRQYTSQHQRNKSTGNTKVLYAMEDMFVSTLFDMLCILAVETSLFNMSTKSISNKVKYPPYLLY